MMSGLTLEADFLGTLAKILTDLQGYDTLAFELIQNADDTQKRDGTPAASRMVFDVDDDAVTVWNDGEFFWCGTKEAECPLSKPCDLHSFLRVASESKRDRDDTWGAFGVGFTAVYQVTDRPELITKGIHLTLSPELPDPRARVTECQGCERCQQPSGTLFRLPWAAEESALRKRLRVEPRRDPDGFVNDLSEALLDALPFLRQVHEIELKRGRARVGCYRRERDDEIVRLIGPDRTVELHRLTADFDDKAAQLRARKGSTIEDKRRSDVEVLVGDLERGRIYAGLPTQQHLPAKMLIAGDFFPHSSRKVISLEHDLKSEWNRAALRAAACAVAEWLPTLPGRIDPIPTWELIASIRRTAVDEDDEAFGDYWAIVSQAAKNSAVLPTSTGELVTPSGSLFVPAEEDDVALPLLAELGANVSSSELRRILNTLPRAEDLGLRDLSPSSLAELLDGVDVDELSPESRRSLWSLMDRLLRRARGTRSLEAAQSVLAKTRTAPEVDGGSHDWVTVNSADSETTELFRPYAFLLDRSDLVELEDVRALASPLKMADAIGVLEDKNGKTLERPLELLRWFLDRRPEIRADPALADRLKKLPIFPARRDREHGREFLPLERISLAADKKGAAFNDVIGIATVLDISVGEDLVVFVKELDIETLDLPTYVEKHAIPALQEAGDEVPEWLGALLLLLGDPVHVTELENSDGLIDALRDVELIPCTDGRHRHPGGAYFGTDDVLSVLGTDAPVASVPRGAEYLAEVLGVAREPRAEDVLRRVSDVTSVPPTELSLPVIHAVIRHLARQVPAHEDAARRALAQPRYLADYGELKTRRWLPARAERSRWFSPDEIYRDNLQHLFSTQADFLEVPPDLRDSARFALETLGVKVQPPLDKVVDHLLECSARNLVPHRDVYRTLNDNSEEDDQLARLRAGRVLFLSDGVWATAREVFWEDHHLGPYGHRLDPAAWQEWHPLLNKLGVRTRPDYTDAVRVLRIIGGEHDGSVLDQDAIHLTLRCWQSIEAALATSALDDAAVRSNLGNAACVVDSANTLARPPEVFVDDSPDLARRFAPHLGSAVIARPRGAWNALRAAGVRGLREWSLARITHDGEPARFSVLTRHLSEREPQIARVIEDGAGSSELETAIARMRDLATFKAADLKVSWVFRADPRVRTQPAATGAVYDGQTHRLYIGGDLDGGMWIDIARELSAAIAPDAGSLGLLKDVLAADDPKDADEILDRLNVPRLTGEIPEAAADDIVGSGADQDERDGAAPHEPEEGIDETEAGDEETASAAETPDDEAAGLALGDSQGEPELDDDAGSDGSVPPSGLDGSTSGLTKIGGTGAGATGGGSGAGGGRGGSGGLGSGTERGPRSPRRPGETEPSEWWYVIVSGKSSPSEDRDLGRDEHERARRRQQIDGAGIEAVCRHERRADRDPEVKPHNHPGYDIASRDQTGAVVRLIEVKSLAGSWGDGGFPRVTPTQFDQAREHSDLAWLYVVEHAESPEPPITRVFDPVGKVDRFVFDPGWRELGEETDELALLSAELRDLVEHVEAAGLPEPEIRFQLDDVDGLTLALAWPDMQVGVAESPIEVMGWTIGVASEWSVDDVRNALGV